MRSKNYSHSRVFADYKVIHEDIQGNLTSLEYLQILDFLLKKAWAPVVALCPCFSRNFVSKVLGYSCVKSAIKLSSDDRDKLFVHIFNFLSSQDTKSSISSFENIHLNRGIISGMVNFFLELGEKYEEMWSPFNDTPLNEKMQKTQKIFLALGLKDKDKDKFFAVYKNVKYWHDRALSFRSKILQKYVRMALLSAKKAYDEYHHIMDLDDITSIYIMTVGKAIDRCDSRLGVLTTFIQNWLQSARSEVQNIINSIIQSSSYETIVDECPESDIFPVISPSTSYENMQYISYQAKKIDSDGCLRISLGIPEILTASQQKYLLNYV